MAYQMYIEGMAEISEMLDRMEERAPAIAAQALYEGAAVMSQAIRKEMDSIKTEPFKYAKNGEQRLPSPEEKAILEHAGVGVAKFDKNGVEIDTSVGFNQDGYANVSWNHMSSKARTNYKSVGGKNVGSGKAKALGIGKGQQNRKPIGAIANAINSGTSFMKKQPFVRKGMKNGSQPALQAMKDRIEQSFEAITKEK